MEVKGEKELFCIPEDLALEPSAAVPVDIVNTLEDNKDNQKLVEDSLGQDNLTVIINEGKGVFKCDGKILSWRADIPDKATPRTPEKTPRTQAKAVPEFAKMADTKAKAVPKVADCKVK